MPRDTQGKAASSADLRLLLDKLPQELYDRIYDFTFAAKPGIRYLDRFNPYPHPMYIPRPLFQKPDSVNLLRVDRASRKQFAESFYGGDGAVFVATCPGPRSMYEVKDLCILWLSTMTPEHRALIKDVRAAVKGHSQRQSSGLVRAMVAAGAHEPGHRELLVTIERIAIAFGDPVVHAFTFGYEDEITSDLPGYRQQVNLLPRRR